MSKRPEIKDNDQRYQVVHRYKVLKMSVSLRYRLKRLCEMLSISLYVAATSQISQFYLRFSETLKGSLKELRLIDELVATS